MIMTSKPTVLVIGYPARTPADIWSSFCSQFNIIFYDFPTIADFHSALSSPSGKCNSITAIIRIAQFPASFEQLEAGWTVAALAHFPSSLRLISHVGHGHDKEDLAALSRKGIKYMNTTGGSESTATIGLYLIIAAFRNLSKYERMARSGQFSLAMQESIKDAEDPYEKSVGIVGMGAIGQALARMVGGLGMYLHYVARSNSSMLKEMFPNAIEHPTLNSLLAEVDCLVLACPYSAATHHLLDQEAFGRMKKGMRVVNIARGKCIDERALIDALENGIVASAGLDVYENEPQISSGLLESDRVTILPHIGGISRDSFISHEKKCLQNVIQYFNEGVILD